MDCIQYIYLMQKKGGNKMIDESIDTEEMSEDSFVDLIQKAGINSENITQESMKALQEGNFFGLMKGYIDYAEEIIAGRALCDGRDGLKCVQRRALYSTRELAKKSKGYMKCYDIVGKTSLLHPHGGDAIYQALVNMTDDYNGMQMPLFDGYGSFGSVVSNEGAAAMRYTEAKLHDNAMDYFGEMQGVKFRPNFNATLTEPCLLPVSYPALLCNSSSGIAVGFSSNIPSFNFNDVIDLTIEYMEKGKCTTVIAPDFPTKGFYIKNDHELMKLMTKGVASLKLRGRLEIVGKQINVVEFPYNKTIQCILKEIKDKNLPNIKKASDYQDHSADMLGITCSSKNKVDDVIMSLYRNTSVQSTFSANMTTVIDGKPVTMGVWDYVRVWVEWRREVLTKQYTSDLEAYKEGIKEPIAFMEVIRDEKIRDTVVDLAVHKSTQEAVDYILANCDNEKVTPDLAKWAVRRGLNNFRNGDKYKKMYDEALEVIAGIEAKLNDIDGEILKQLRTLKARKGHLFPRQTEITDVDYVFDKEEKEVFIDTNEVYYLINKDGFINKMRYEPTTDDRSYIIQARACDTLIGFDNYGHLLRVYGEHLPYDNASNIGTFIPKYAGVEEQDAKVMYMDLLDGSKKMIIYTDGFVSFLDTKEWYEQKKQLKYIKNGISGTDAYKAGWVFDVDENFENKVIMAVNTNGEIGVKRVADIKEKGRTARTRVFNTACDISSIAFVPEATAFTIMPNYYSYLAPKMRNLMNDADFSGDMSHFYGRFIF